MKHFLLISYILKEIRSHSRHSAIKIVPANVSLVDIEDHVYNEGDVRIK